MVLALLLAMGFGLLHHSLAHATGPALISFQGKVVNADGTNVTNGSYNFDFVMYDDATLGTPSDGVRDKWHELTKSVTVTNGVFQTNLGSATALPDFNANPSLYLAVRFNADAAGYMSPRVQMASVPYALNADKVGGILASGLVQLGATQTGNINIGSGTITSGLINGQTISSSANFTGTVIIQGSSALTLGTASTSSGAIIMKSAGGTNTVTFQGPDTNPTVSYTIKLPTTAPALSQCLQNDGTTLGQLAFAACGDSVSVNGSSATDANFLDTTATASVAGVVFSLATVPNPDTISLVIGTASGTVAGIITATTQTIGGIKTFTGDIIEQATLSVAPTNDSLNGFVVADQIGNKVLNVNTTTTKNLLANGSFEGATNGWSVVGGSTLSSRATQALVGTRSLSVASAVTNPSGTSYTYPFKANTTYSLSFSAYAATTMTSIFSFGRTINGAATDCTTNTTLTSAWTAFSCTFTSGATVTQADNIYIQKTGATTPTFFLDAVQVEQAAAATSYDDPGTSLVNLIDHPNFESSNTNGWAVKSGTTPVGNSISSSSDFAYYGTQSLKIVTGTSAAAGNGAEYRYQFQPSSQYSLSFWGRKDAGSSTAFAVGRQDVAGTDVNCTTIPDITTTGLTTTWTQFSCTFVTGATITEPSNLYIKQTDTATSDNVYIDGITLVQAASGLSFAPSAGALQINTITNEIILNGSGSGELQPWRTSSSPIGAASPTGTAQNREQAASATANGYIYSIGGYDGTTAQSTVYYTKLNTDGSTQGWSTAANALPAVLRYPAATVANGYMYVVGGANTAGTAQTSIYYSKLNSDGSVGLWQTSAVVLPLARLGSSVVVLNGIIYIMGGCTDTTCTTNAVNTTYYGKLTADGSIRGITTPQTLDTNVNNITQNRGMGSAVAANGYIYYVGGSGSTPVSGANSTVYYASINSDGSLAAFSAGASLPAVRAQHVSVVVNGYIYSIGGCSALTTGSCTSGAAAGTVFYSNLNGDGTLTAWSTGANALPDFRGSPAITFVNSYIYVLGGFDGTNRASTVFYASTPRTLIAGGLDLVGLNSQSLAEYGGGGNLTAGNTRVVGALTVDGYADFNNGVSIDSALNINAITSTIGQTVFNINNSSANSIFSVQHMSANFGSLASAGAFISNTSTFDEEFSGNKQVAALTVDTLNVGDTSTFNFDTFAATTTYSTPLSVLNGVVRISLSGAIGNGFVLGVSKVSGTLHATYLKANLPVVQMKIKPSLNNAGEDIRWGLVASALAASATNDATTTDGIFFSNENTTSWVGVVRSGGANVGTVTCTGTISNTQFSTGRIVVESASLVHFYMDYDASNGINFQDCGTVAVNTNPTVALALAIFDAHSVASASTIDVDYMRTWQDDAPVDTSLVLDITTPVETSLDTTAGDTPVEPTPAPLTNDNGGSTAGQMGIIDFLTATSEDMVFNKDVYVHGTLYADKIRANQIEGLQVFTDKIASLQDQIDKDNQKPTTATVPTANATTSTSGLSLDNVTIQTASIVLNLSVEGGLNVGADSSFHGNTMFYKLVTFVEKSIFKNDVSFEGHLLTAGDKPDIMVLIAAGNTQTSADNPESIGASATVEGNDSTGQLKLTLGSGTTAGDFIKVTFKKPYTKAPQILLTPANAAAANVKYYVTASTTGFIMSTTDIPSATTSIVLNYWVIQ